ncbi:MAG: beta-glucosidase BglX [Leptospiraceae bacterium]|nr:beta-glucosidase BglX [Leptospiraceae bacterium]
MSKPDTSNERKKQDFLNELIGRMTVEEKVGQLRLISIGPENPTEKVLKMIENSEVGAIFNTRTKNEIRKLQEKAVNSSSKKIPLFFAFDVVHGERTIFPIPLGLASSWDVSAIETVGRVSAFEATEDGLNLTWAPMLDVSRDPRWGRVSEGFGEDTYLTSELGRAMVLSLQGESLRGRHSLASTIKHFALYGAVEGGRDYNSVDMSLQRMFQEYFPPYQIGIESGAIGVMVALNTINGVPANSNQWLLKKILREDWKFSGLTVSDHGAIKELIEHGVADSPRDAVRISLQSGVNMSMSDEFFGKFIPDLIARKELKIEELDSACRSVLGIKYDMGLFEDPFVHVPEKPTESFETNSEERLHRKEAREVAAKTIVLLKNENQVLSIKKKTKLAVIGPLADSKRDIMGSWSAAGVAGQSVTVLEGLKNVSDSGIEILYSKGSNVIDDPKIIQFLNQYEFSVDLDEKSPDELLREAKKVAGKADLILAVLGESQAMANEASSRSEIRIPESQKRLLRELKKIGKPIILLLMNGRPLSLVEESEIADAILESWFSGTEGGNAIADVILGKVNPSGKLPMSFPRSEGQIPVYYNHLNTGRPYNEKNPDKYTSHYYDDKNGPLYPFGFGLSYSKFHVSDIEVSGEVLSLKKPILAKVEVKNVSGPPGETVVQLYIRDLTASISRPVLELKGFKKVFLNPGETKEISFEIQPKMLEFWNSEMNLISEKGKFKVFIGLDSLHLKEKEIYLEE